MDWNLKTPSWDLADFEHETIPNIDMVSGSSSFVGHGIKEDFSVDLKLGHVVESRNELGDNMKMPNVTKMAVSPSGSSKRARAITIQTAFCLVDGCNADLSNCREYHRRHKVCETHSKTPQVTINGHKQRFCQQCSRFHSLDEFDDGKRSCRKRLDGHNRRRRKPQPEPLSRAGSLFPSHDQGSRLLQFYNQQVYPTATTANPIWAGLDKTQEDVSHSQLPNKHDAFPEFSSSSDRRGKQISFMNRTNLELSSHQSYPGPPSVCQPLLNNIASSGSGDGFSAREFHSDYALSLLSSSPSQTTDIGLSCRSLQNNSIPLVHPLDTGLHYNSLEPMESILVPPNVSDPDVHCLEMFHMPSPHASRGSGTPQTFPSAGNKKESSLFSLLQTDSWYERFRRN